MSFSEMTKVLKQRNKGKIVFIKVGAFYIAVAEDAVFLNKLLNLKCTCYTKYTCKVGVPIDSLQKYLDKLEEEKYAYIVYSLDKEKVELKVEKEKEGKAHNEKEENKNCLYCKGVSKFDKDMYMEAVLKLYEER